MQLRGDVDGEAANNNSERHLALSADSSTLAIAACGYGNNDGGFVSIYRLDGTDWKSGHKFVGAPGHFLGTSVGLSASGNILDIGANQKAVRAGGSQIGYITIYHKSSHCWAQRGSDIAGESSGAFFGSDLSPSSDGNTVAIAALWHDRTGGWQVGLVQVYRYERREWRQLGSDI